MSAPRGATPPTPPADRPERPSAPPAGSPSEAAAPFRLLARRDRFSGLLLFHGVACVEGDLKGSVFARGKLIVTADAQVQADVEVTELELQGKLQGDVRATSRVKIETGATLHGSVTAPRIQVADGAQVQGPVQISAPKASG